MIDLIVSRLWRKVDPRRPWAAWREVIRRIRRTWQVALGPMDAPKFRYLIKHGRLPEEDA